MVSSRRKRQSTTDDDQDAMSATTNDPAASDDVAGSMEDSSSSTNKKQKVEKNTKPTTTKEEKEDMAWICTECKEAECGLVDADDSADFLICDGPCHRIFHIPCAGLTKAPSTNDDWLCQDCSRKEHACAYCSEYGTDYVDVFPCQDDQCGLFFHEACLRLHHVDYTYSADPSHVVPHNNCNNDNKITKSTTSETEDSIALQNEKLVSDDNDEDEQDEEYRIPLFTCHAHRCWTCTQKDMIQLEKDERLLEQQNQKGDKTTKNKKGKSSRKKRKKNTSIFKCKPGRLYVSYRKRRKKMVSHRIYHENRSRYHDLSRREDV